MDERPRFSAYIKPDHAAIHLFQDFAEIETSRSLARWHIGIARRLYDNKQLESALRHFFKAASLFGAAFDFSDAEDVPTIHEVMTFIACIHQRMNRHPEARRYFMRCAELDPVRSAD